MFSDDGHGEHVAGLRADVVGDLALGQVAHGGQPVAVAGGLLELVRGRGLLHLRLQPPLERPHAARQELDHAVDHRRGSPRCEISPTQGAAQRPMW